MGGDDQRSRPAVEVVLDHRERVDVEVVRRLVEQQDVRFADQQPQELQAAPLPTGQFSDAGDQPITGEPELLQQVGRRGVPTGGQPGLGPQPVHRCQDAILVVQFGDVLAQMGQAQGEPVLDPAGRRPLPTGEQPQQGGLTGPVSSDQADPVAGSYRPGYSVEQRPTVGQHHRRVGKVDDVLAQPGHRELRELQPVARLGDVGDQLIGGLNAELRLAGAGRRATPQPSEFLADEVAAALFVGGRLPTPFGPSQDVSGITTLVVVHLGVVHFPDPGADGVQEPAVVADHQHGDTTLLQFAQVLGQPVHRLHVEVVGRLIEHQQVVAAGQQSGQGGPPPLAARQI